MTIRDADISYLYSVDDQRMYKEIAAPSEVKREYYLSDAMGKVIALRSTVTPYGQGSSTTWEFYAHGSEREARLVKINGGAKFGTDEVSFFLYDHLGNTRINYTPYIEEQQAATNVLFDDQFLGGSLDGWGTSSTGTIVNSGGSLTVSDASNVVAIKNVNMTAGNTYTIELNIDMGSMSNLTLYISGNSIGALSSGGNTFNYTPVNSGSVGLIINGGTGGSFGIKGAKLTENVPHVLTQNLKINSVMDYYPYGKIIRQYVNGDDERYLTTQHERDAETGLDYRGARYYDADVARFLSLDPLATKFPEWSAYNYVIGNPLVFIDPSGREPEVPSMHDQEGEPEKKKKGQTANQGAAGAAISKATSAKNSNVKNSSNRSNNQDSNNGMADKTSSTIKKYLSSINNVANNNNYDILVASYYEWSSYSLFSGGGSSGTLYTTYHGSRSYTTDYTYNNGVQFKTELFSTGPGSGVILSTGPASEVPIDVLEGLGTFYEVNASAVFVDVGVRVSISDSYNDRGDYLITIGNQISVGVGTPFVSGGVTNSKTNIY